ncbi:hypothetical protein GOQ27_05530 [Clostridium sp. D2Q-11]|uniref:Lipoprotein n=1 Tax=Anaeromonas frigoriresistens TaxID=2683708 RepID=A0A942UYF3_9FIRM|nr:hypothetical protein [Anaeromonas frigoriresistens]MBS4537912.1 hypothetical protein [Anaeromonas frigoriresistens]
MKKNISIFLIALIIFSFTGCKGSDLKSYGDAVEKTNSITKGQMELNMDMDLDINTQGMTEEELKAMNYFKTMKGKMRIKFDETEKFISRNYFNFGGLGFDLDVFGNGEDIYLQMPIIGKYINVKEFDENKQSSQENEFISENSKVKISEKWVGFLQEDDVFSGKSTVMDTPDGEVKVTEYTIQMEKGKLKEFASYVINTVAKDENFRNNLANQINTSNGNEQVTIDDIINNSEEMIEGANVGAFNYTAYVDIDGYIVKEVIKVTMDSSDSEKINSATFNMNINRWGIEKKQEFDFPDINEDNILKESEIDQEMPFNFGNIDK